MNKRRLITILPIIVGFFALCTVYPAAAQEDPSFDLPGWTEGTGTRFELPDSPYLPVTLDSSVTVTLTLSSVPELVDLLVDAHPTEAAAEFTFSGFAPSTLYYRYTDTTVGPVAFTTDSSGGFTYTQDLSKLHHVWFQTQPSTWYLRDDAAGGDCGYFGGSWDFAAKTCTLGKNVEKTIEIVNDGLTLDGAGYQLTDGSYGVYIADKHEVTVKNLHVTNTVSGIYIQGGSGNRAENNTLSNCVSGITLGGSSNNTVSSNMISGGEYGISGPLKGSSNNTITHNEISGTMMGIYGPYDRSHNNVINGNVIMGSGAGKYGIRMGLQSDDNTVYNNTMSNYQAGLYFRGSLSDNNQIYNNNFVANFPDQIYVDTRDIGKGNVFNLPEPEGGNFFSNYNTPDQGCVNKDPVDTFCDSPYAFTGGTDDLPWITQNGWQLLAMDDAYSLDEDQVLSVTAPGVLDNDIAPQGDPLSAALVSEPAEGSLFLNADGSFTYTPHANYHGTDSFIYAANDGTGSSLATVFLRIDSVNDPPVIDLNGVDEEGIDFNTLFLAGQPPVLAGDADLTLTDVDAGVVDAVSGSGMVYVVDIAGYVFAVDPQTGSQTPVNTAPMPKLNARMMTIDTVTQELFFAANTGDIWKVDIATGAANPVASGGYLAGAWGIDLAPDGDIVVAASVRSRPLRSYIVRVDRLTGSQTLVSTSPDDSRWHGLAVAADGSIFVTDLKLAAIVKVDPVSGAQALLTKQGAIRDAYDIAIDPAGDLFVVEIGRSGQITQVDPGTGAETLIAVGSPLTYYSYGIDADGAGNLITSNCRDNVMAKTEIATGAQIELVALKTSPYGVAVDAANLQFIEWVTVQITNLADAPYELLAADTTGTNIVAAYDASTGTLSLIGTDSAENYQAVLRTATYDNTAPSSGQRLIEFVANDGTDSNFPTAQTTITLNSPPTANAGGPYGSLEGSAIVLDSASSADPDGDPLSFAWSVTDPALCSFDDPALLHPELTCLDDGDFTVKLTVSDGFHKPVSSSASVTVANVPPSVDAITLPLDPLNIGEQPVSVSAAFSDPGAGYDAPYTCTVDHGDGSGPQNGTTGGYTCSGPDHTYEAAGVYQVSVAVTDTDGESGTATADTFIVIYDPNDGFVTGGGWIASPEGAYVPDPGLTGKASFGFVSKYKSGATRPSGSTEFNFKTADLNFHSSSYDWLVVNQSSLNAQYKGSGTINGQGAYKFMLWAGDGEPDTFRMKIWLENEEGEEDVVYDNGFDQAIGGGSIVVHIGK